MFYENLREAVFIERLNRFVAAVNLDGERVLCHVRNTGRLKELFVPGARVFIEESSNTERKYKYSLVQVYKGEQLVNIDSLAPNKMAAEWAAQSGFFGENPVIMSEKTYGKSRFDLYIESGERKIFVEVKGVTLENERIACFPDAPTLRGVKHINELAASVAEGYEAYILFVIQMKGVDGFSPNYKTQPEFGEALKKAGEAGVGILAYDCVVFQNKIYIDKPVPVIL